ncbi:MAG: hypothetical protein IKA67_01765, partial [Clostridia bacterium]|nr:hypothetical protein [Clostridia bacterium]
VEHAVAKTQRRFAVVGHSLVGDEIGRVVADAAVGNGQAPKEEQYKIAISELEKIAESLK